MNQVIKRELEAGGLTLTELSALPSISTLMPDPKVSARYQFLSTLEVAQEMGNKGWYPVGASQTGNTPYGVHYVRFEHPVYSKIDDKDRFNVIAFNSHNTVSSFRFAAGINVWACLNLCIGASDMLCFDRVRHTGDAKQTVQWLLQNIDGTVENVMHRISQFKEFDMTNGALRSDFTRQALSIRHPEGIKHIPKDILEGRSVPWRKEQNELNLWNVYNHLQELLIRGGGQYMPSEKPNEDGIHDWRMVRPVTHIKKVKTYNEKLWRLAEETARLHIQ